MGGTVVRMLLVMTVATPQQAAAAIKTEVD